MQHGASNDHVYNNMGVIFMKVHSTPVLKVKSNPFF